jgi:hypothetical protein
MYTGASVPASDDGHDGGSDIGVDAVSAASRAAASSSSRPAVVDSPTHQDEGQDAVVAGPQPRGASALRRHRRLVILIAIVVVIGIAAGVTAIYGHGTASSGGPPGGVDTSAYTVTYEVTGSTHSATLRYTLYAPPLNERDDLDLAEMARPDPYTPHPTPYLIETTFPRDSHAMIEVRNNLPTGNVACTIDYGVNNGASMKKRSAHGTSVATCEAYLQ